MYFLIKFLNIITNIFVLKIETSVACMCILIRIYIHIYTHTRTDPAETTAEVRAVA